MGPLKEREIKAIAKELFTAISFMHKENLTYIVLKPQNIFVNNPEMTDLKLSDFGFATYLDKKPNLNKLTDTAYYMAPELIKGQLFDSKVDVWSAGIILYFLMYNSLPF